MPIERTEGCTLRLLWLENLFLGTTTVLLGWGKPAGGICRWWDNGDGLSNREYILGRCQAR